MFFEKIVPKIENLESLPSIPLESVEGWKKILVKECGEKLVPVGAFSEFSDCDTSAVYFGERGKDRKMNFLGKAVNRDVSLITHFVREGVFRRLGVAQSLLPEDYYFRFFDNFRPLDVQQALYDDQKEKFRKDHLEWSETRLEEETQKDVSLPSPNKERGTTHPSPHSTGGVADLTIVKLNNEGKRFLKELEQKKMSGKLDYSIKKEEKDDIKVVNNWIEKEAERKRWDKQYKEHIWNNWLSNYRYAREKARIFKNYTSSLNMGTDFDHFGPEAGIRYFEDLAKQRELTGDEKEILRNRRFLYRVMKEVGFSNYPEEWWHFSYGDNMDAANSGKESAIYGGVEMSEDNIAFEKARRGPYFDSMGRIGEKGLFTGSIEDDPTKIAA